MSDLTIYAEALISTVVRAFYDDDVICIIDVLIRDKFLRDDDMSPRLNIPAKKLRATLQYLADEHLVRNETVDDLAQGGSQATKFYYIDYNRAVHSIRLRIYLLKKQLERAELHARSQSFYLCPGYSIRRCNGRYTEQDAQQIIDYDTGMFLCNECYSMYLNDPNQPDKATYTLKLVDNTKELRTAIDNIRRVNVQLTNKMIGNQQLRAGIYDLLQKVRNNTNTNNKGGSNITTNNTNRLPITSNLPSENFALGIGSKRLAGTGRTAGIKEKKLLQQGFAQSAIQARNYLVGNKGEAGNDNSDNDEDDDNNNHNNSNNHNNNNRMLGVEELLFLKNAMGHEIQFTIERGGAARAQILVSSSYKQSRKNKRGRRKLMDAAASKVYSSSSIPIHMKVLYERNKKRKLDEQKKMKQGSSNNNNKSKLMQIGDTFDFLKDNIGRLHIEEQERQKMHAIAIAAAEAAVQEEEEKKRALEATMNNSNNINNTNDESIFVLSDDTTEEIYKLSDEKRLATFQAAYNSEMERQEKLLQLLDDNENNNNNNSATTNTTTNNNNNNTSIIMGYNNNNDDDDLASILWEDGDVYYN